MSSINRDFQDKVVITLLNDVTTNQQSATFPIPIGTGTLEAFINGTGAVAGTINIYGCNTKRSTNGILLATISLSGTNSDQVGSILTTNWGYIYAVLSGISGTSAKVTLSLGV